VRSGRVRPRHRLASGVCVVVSMGGGAMIVIDSPRTRTRYGIRYTCKREAEIKLTTRDPTSEKMNSVPNHHGGIIAVQHDLKTSRAEPTSKKTGFDPQRARKKELKRVNERAGEAPGDLRSAWR